MHVTLCRSVISRSCFHLSRNSIVLYASHIPSARNEKTCAAAARNWGQEAPGCSPLAIFIDADRFFLLNHQLHAMVLTRGRRSSSFLGNLHSCQQGSVWKSTNSSVKLLWCTARTLGGSNGAARRRPTAGRDSSHCIKRWWEEKGGAPISLSTFTTFISDPRGSSAIFCINSG